jgi:hypothetical protein
MGRKINVSGPLLKEKALKFAKDLNKPEFKVSNGWLEAFIKRNNIVILFKVTYQFNFAFQNALNLSFSDTKLLSNFTTTTPSKNLVRGV